MTTKSEIKKMNKAFTCLTMTRRDISEYNSINFSEDIALMLPDEAIKTIAEQVGHDCIQQFQDSVYERVKLYLIDNGFKEIELFIHIVWIKGEYTDADLDAIYEELENGEEKKGKTSGGVWYLGCSDE